MIGRLLFLTPLIVAAAPAEEGLDGSTLVLMATAVVAVVVLRGVLLRRHLRKRRGPGRPGSQQSAAGDTATSVDSGADCASDGDGGGGCD